jgi:hypothetical protein
LQVRGKDSTVRHEIVNKVRAARDACEQFHENIKFLAVGDVDPVREALPFVGSAPGGQAQGTQHKPQGRCFLPVLPESQTIAYNQCSLLFFKLQFKYFYLSLSRFLR